MTSLRNRSERQRGDAPTGTPDAATEVTPEPASDLVLGPATRLLWRSPEEIHLEMGQTAVVVDGLPVDTVRRMSDRRAAPDGDPAATVEQDAHVRETLTALGESGLLWPRADGPDDLRLRPPAPRLAGELATLAVHHGHAAATVLQARHRAAIEVHGTGRAAVALASALAAAGVGRVRCVAGGDIRLLHAVPGGLLPADEGRPVAAGAQDALRRAAPDVDTTPLPPDRPPDLAVLALDSPVSDEQREALHARGTAHLSVSVTLDRGVVGPLVLPGLTSCLRCADLLRSDRDPAWRLLSLQLATPSRYGAMSAVAVTTIVVGVAAMQALALLDGTDPATIDGTLELQLPDWRLRRRSWTTHPDCGCTPPTVLGRDDDQPAGPDADDLDDELRGGRR